MFTICEVKGVSRECEGILGNRAYTEADEFIEKNEKPLDYFIFNIKEMDRWDLEMSCTA